MINAEAPPHRCWLIERLPDGMWVGRTSGRLPLPSMRTDAGPLDQVMHAVSKPENRRGLPILVEAGRG
jgi:hypothetical protein